MTDYKELNKANVYLRDDFVGLLEKNAQDRFLFTYDEDWLKKEGPPISLTMPLADGPYSSRYLFPFFDNLIPEGWPLFHAEKFHKIDKRNRFALLLAEGLGSALVIKQFDVDQKGRQRQVEDFAKDIEIKHLTQEVFSKLDDWMKTACELVGQSYLPDDSKKRYLEIIDSRYKVLNAENADGQ